MAEQIVEAMGDWWKASTRDSYREVAERLLSIGLDRSEVLSMLEKLRRASASEYGD